MKMNFIVAKSSSIYETFSPLYKVLKFFGIIPFQLDMKSGKVAIKCSDLILMLAFWIFWSWLVTANLILGAREPGEASKILLCGWHWVLIFQLLSSFFIQMVNLLRRKSIEKLFKLIDEVDMMNTSLMFKANHSNFKTLTVQTIIGSQLINYGIGVFTTFITYLQTPEVFDLDFHLSLAFTYISLVYCLTYHQFLFATSSIKLRFKLLNMNLSSFFTSHHMTLGTSCRLERLPQNFPEHSSAQIGFIRRVAIMHDKLNDAVEIVNYSFSYELLPGMILTSLATIFTCFNVFRMISNPDTNSIVLSVINIVWAWYFLIFLIACIFMADTTTKSANDTLKITSMIINNTSDEALLDKLSIFTQQIKHRTTILSCGLFTIDWSLAFSMVSAVTTYLFIILQFEMSKTPST